MGAEPVSTRLSSPIARPNAHIFASFFPRIRPRVFEIPHETGPGLESHFAARIPSTPSESARKNPATSPTGCGIRGTTPRLIPPAFPWRKFSSSRPSRSPPDTHARLYTGRCVPWKVDEVAAPGRRSWHEKSMLEARLRAIASERGRSRNLPADAPPSFLLFWRCHHGPSVPSDEVSPHAASISGLPDKAFLVA